MEMKINGYTKLASLMGPHPEVAIFRRFGTLNIRNLLYLQAELSHLEDELQRCTAADLESQNLDRANYDRDWLALSESGGNSAQWTTVKEIRKVLREYNEALFHQTFLVKLAKPNSRDLGFLQYWMQNPDMGSVYFLGADRDIYEKPDLADLVALKSPEYQNRASRVLGNFVVSWYHWLIGHRFKKPEPDDVHANTVVYSHSTLGRLGALLGTVCASILPMLAIVVLHFVTSMAKRLVIIGLFTAQFSATLCVFTNARLIEIFSATAAFAAVQVVFVGTTSGNFGNEMASSVLAMSAAVRS